MVLSYRYDVVVAPKERVTALCFKDRVAAKELFPGIRRDVFAIWVELTQGLEAGARARGSYIEHVAAKVRCHKHHVEFVRCFNLKSLSRNPCCAFA